MKKARFHNLSVWWLAVCFAGLALGAAAQPETFGGNPDSSRFIRIPSNTDDWTRHFHIGAMVGMNISASFNLKGTFNVTGKNPLDGEFDDGYVRVDQTGNAGGYTGYWGYNWGENNATAANPSQYDAVHQTLAMHSTTSFTAAGGSKADGSVFPGFDMAYGGNLWYWKHARVGWEIGFGLLPISIADKSPMGATVNQSTYVFNVGNIVVPDAPYQGGPSGEGEPIIPGTIPSPSGETNYTGTVSGSHSLDVMLYTVRLGPTFYWDLTEHMGVSLGAGPAVGIVSGDYKYDETISAGGVSAHNAGQISGTKIVYGGYVNAMLMCHVVENADIYVGAQFMPMGNATIGGSSGGGYREGRLNLGGQVYISAGINWPF